MDPLRIGEDSVVEFSGVIRVFRGEKCRLVENVPSLWKRTIVLLNQLIDIRNQVLDKSLEPNSNSLLAHLQVKVKIPLYGSPKKIVYLGQLHGTYLNNWPKFLTVVPP